MSKTQHIPEIKGTIPMSSRAIASDILPLDAAELSPSNRRRLDTAVKHFRSMFMEAVTEQVDGQHFYGSVEIRVPFEHGDAQDIQVSRIAKFR